MPRKSTSDVCFIQIPPKSPCPVKKSTPNSPSHKIEHEYVYAPCSKCRKSHYQQHTIVSGFVLKFVDQMCPYRSKNISEIDNNELLKYIDLDSVCSGALECYDPIHTDYEPPVKLKKECDPKIKRNGLNPSDTFICARKSTQCCGMCVKLQRSCLICSGQKLFRNISQCSRSESSLDCYYMSSTAGSTKDQGTMVCTSMILREMNDINYPVQEASICNKTYSPSSIITYAEGCSRYCDDECSLLNNSICDHACYECPSACSRCSVIPNKRNSKTCETQTDYEAQICSCAECCCCGQQCQQINCSRCICKPDISKVSCFLCGTRIPGVYEGS